MTNHSYFNLSGHDAGEIESHFVQIFSDEIAEVREGAIPTGRLISVENTPMDFRKNTRIFDRIEEDYDQLKITGGYDHNYVNKGTDAGIQKVAILSDEKSGRVMEVYTDLPGVQLYAGNCIEEMVGKDGATYNKRHGVCFETQYYPNAINIENFPSPITGPNKPFESTTIFKFC
jgi:aldose 1-epimerase